MRQLVDHFQQTSYTPRNFNALLPTPRFAYSSSNFHAGGGCLDDIDPNCFEEGAVTFTSFSSNPSQHQHQHQRVSGEISLQSSDHTYGGSRHPTGGEILARGVDRYRESGGWDKDDSNSTSSSCDAVQAYLDAPVNAAVNVALKCATREASFEEVLSWLGRAPDHFVHSSLKIDNSSATSSPIVDETTLQETSFSSTSTATSTHSDVHSSSGMSLPSHLRPPLIVTAGIPEKGIGSLGSTPVPTPTPGNSDDHLFLVELLSNMKSSPKWGQQDTYVPVAPHVHIAPTPYDRKRLQQVQSGNGNYAVHFNGNGNGHESKGADYGIGYNNSRGSSSKRLKVEGQTEASMPWKRSSDEVATPTDRALKRVRAELKRRDRQKAEGLEHGQGEGQGRGLGALSGLGNGHSDGHMTSQSGAPDRDRDVVPFQLLPFFEYLDDHAQR